MMGGRKKIGCWAFFDHFFHPAWRLGIDLKRVGLLIGCRERMEQACT